MTDIYYALIIFPVIFLIITALVFASSLREIKLQQFLLSCPYPIYNGDVVNASLPETGTGWLFTYTVVQGNATQNQDGKFFDCRIDRLAEPDAPSVSIINKEYGATLFSTIPYGYFAYLADNLVVTFGKLTPFFTILVTVFNAPAVVSGITWFGYVNIILIVFIAVGITMVIRG